jgi:hypothetical protein
MWEFRIGEIDDYQFVNVSRWKSMIAAHHIWWLECYGLEADNVLRGNPSDYMQYFTLDKWTLRQVISQIASNAWAKADKKMTVEKDFDLYRGQKSLFHSLRIMMFGIQIARDGHITDYKEANYLWDEIYKMGNCGWPVYAEKYKALSNKLHSDFVALCPKPDEYKKENQGKNKKMEEEKEFLKQRAIFCGLPNVWVMYKDAPYLVFGYGAGRLELLTSQFSSCTYPEAPLIKEVQVILRKEEDLNEEEKKEYTKIGMTDELEDWMNIHCVDHRDLISRGWAVDAASLGDKNPYKYGVCFGGLI